jgi:3-deoxy-D-manno-octulosonate 8-phosphate phosphatase (KDO 8-P phosphatase)
VDSVVSLTHPSRVLLTPLEVQSRARRVRLVLTDCDGVLTDGSVYYGPLGEALRRFSVRDGMGVERLRDAGVETGILSGERSDTILRRAEKLALPHVFLGIRDKAAHLPTILAAAGVGLDEMAYIGDDRNDLGLMLLLAGDGLTAAPADAQPDVSNTVHYRCANPGGHEAFREFAEWILRHRSEPEPFPRRGV